MEVIYRQQGLVGPTGGINVLTDFLPEIDVPSFTRCVVDNNKNAYIVGSFNGTIFTGANMLSSDLTDIYVAKIDEDGNVIATAQGNITMGDMGDTGDMIDIPTAIGIGITLSENNIYITGTFSGK